MRSLAHACKVLIGVDSPDTQVTERELQCLLAHSNGAGVVVEIGTYEGRTTAALAQNTDGIVYSIDPFVKGRLGICYGEWIAKHYCRRQKLKNIKFLKAYSYDVAPRFEHEINFLFMDADHSYEAVKRDWEDWFPKVKIGGAIALHDSKQAENSPGHLGSMKFYDQYLPNVNGIEELEGVGSLAIFKVTSAKGKSDVTRRSKAGLSMPPIELNP